MMIALTAPATFSKPKKRTGSGVADKRVCRSPIHVIHRQRTSRRQKNCLVITKESKYRPRQTISCNNLTITYDIVAKQNTHGQ